MEVVDNGFWDNQKFIGDFICKNSQDYIGVSLCRRNKQEYVDIRQYYSNDGIRLFPTKKGILLRLDLAVQVFKKMEKIIMRFVGGEEDYE